MNYRTERISKTHRIENTGRHAKYGKGYLWNNTLATVAPYDKVEWKWNIATSGSSPGINIFEVECAAATIYNEKGIYQLPLSSPSWNYLQLHSMGFLTFQTYPYPSTGYSSGDQSLTGVFSRTFVGLGTSYYTSENVIDGESIRLGGSVLVELPTESKHKIEVKTKEIAAVHQPSGM